MNGFEPLRRRIIDYTVAGQWSEVYDGPLEDCESEKLKAENAQLRQQLADVTESMGRVEERCAKLRELAENLKACNSSCGRCVELYGICEHENELQALGIEVDG